MGTRVLPDLCARDASLGGVYDRIKAEAREAR